VDALLLVEQTLNGFQLGVMLFLMAAGLKMVFGIMDFINLAHGTFYMVGAFVGATAFVHSGSFAAGLAAGVASAALAAVALERTALKRLYAASHLNQVLATYALILTFNEAVKVVWGPQPIFAPTPAFLSGSVTLLPGLDYPVYRLAMLILGAALALALWFLISRTRFGMQVRAGATHRETVQALGVNIGAVNAAVFALGAGLAGFAGFMAGPILAVQVGMGEQILIMTFVVVVIGGLGSVRGAFLGALLVGLVDTWSRALLPSLLRLLMPPSNADAIATGVASLAVYLLMAVVLAVRPQGLFPRHG